MKGTVSQRDIARLAGVSPMTVSLALRGHPSIPSETRERVQRIAEEHHYRPDPALAALNAYRLNQTPSRFQGTLGWVTCFPTRHGWRDMIQVAGYFGGAAERADRLGYRLEEFWVNEPGLSPQRATRILLARGIRGLVIAPLPTAQGEIQLEWSHFAAVALGYSLVQPKLHVVMNHQFRNMKRVVKQLHTLGHRRIGFAMPRANDERVDHNYLGGYLIAQHDFEPTAARLTPLLAQPFDEETFRTWFLDQRPDGIVVAASMIYHVRDWLRTLGLTVPGDVSLAVAALPYQDQHVSGIDENVPAIGAHAVETVVGMIHRNELGVPERQLSLLLEGVWRAGHTTTPASAANVALQQ